MSVLLKKGLKVYHYTKYSAREETHVKVLYLSLIHIFGFTEKEVFAALDQFGLSERKQEVKTWYDGFTFGEKRDIYNPWSVTNFLDKKEFRPYWAATSSDSLISKLIQSACKRTIASTLTNICRSRG